MNTGQETPARRRVAEEAAAWLLRQQDDRHDQQSETAFRDWLAADEAHRHEYLTLQRLWSGLNTLDRRNRRRRKLSVMAAVALTVLAPLVAMQAIFSRQEVVNTQVAEIRQQILADGTIAELDADSQLEIDYSPWRRRVIVRQGQVQFKVADSLRPFEVRAAGATVRDIGTTFNLHVRGQQAAVSVQEGIVEVALDAGGLVRRLVAGQQLDYRASDSSLPQPRTVADTVPPWREGRWVFSATPLAEVVEEINRHHAHPLVLDDAGLAAYRVSGVFEQSDRQGLLRALAAVLPLRVEERGDQTILRQR